jgi:hypothetical protein
MPTGISASMAFPPALDPIGGLQGRSIVRVVAGTNVTADVRLLGRGDVHVDVVRPDGSVVSNATVTLTRGSFPNDSISGTTDAAGSLFLGGSSEGPFSVEAPEGLTGLCGRSTGDVIRESRTDVVVTIRAAGTVLGRFLAPDGATPIPNAQIDIRSQSGPTAYATTDTEGRFDIDAIALGPFTVAALDPATRRIGTASGTISYQGHRVTVTLLPYPRGDVEGVVVAGDGSTPVPGATVHLRGQGGGATVHVQSTSDSEGRFQFDGVPAGMFMFTVDAVNDDGLRGMTTGTLQREGDQVDVAVTLAGVGAIRVTVTDESGQPTDQVRIDYTSNVGVFGNAALDTNGVAVVDGLRLGNYAIVATSLADSHNGGLAVAVLDTHGETNDVAIGFGGVGDVRVHVVQADGFTSVSGAQVFLTSSGAFADDDQTPFGD